MPMSYPDGLLFLRTQRGAPRLVSSWYCGDAWPVTLGTPPPLETLLSNRASTNRPC